LFPGFCMVQNVVKIIVQIMPRCVVGGPRHDAHHGVDNDWIHCRTLVINRIMI
jgi:hypothetical protein